MRRILVFTLVLIGLMTPVALAQQLYTHEKVDYTFELPSATWKAILEPDAAHEHPEFVYGDRLDGFLTIRKEIVDAGTTAFRTCATRSGSQTAVSAWLRRGQRRNIQRQARRRDDLL